MQMVFKFKNLRSDERASVIHFKLGFVIKVLKRISAKKNN